MSGSGVRHERRDRTPPRCQGLGGANENTPPPGRSEGSRLADASCPRAPHHRPSGCSLGTESSGTGTPATFNVIETAV